MIVNFYGGDIFCDSKWQHGTTFIFYIALEKLVENKQLINRIKNPIKKNYIKIKLMSNDESNQIIS
jgi:hypothetical protein